mmetsp:Transcript_22203/g.57045  ORF Transcript_22203/g.57045 Transcript_22203/m.57045 type:complete len:94 (+) Transcript_22203:145-426(+)
MEKGTDYYSQQHEKSSSYNPCEAIDRESSVSLILDAYHINRDNTCSQVCIPHMFRVAAQMRGVKFGGECDHLGYPHEFEEGVSRGVHYFKYYQ